VIGADLVVKIKSLVLVLALCLAQASLLSFRVEHVVAQSEWEPLWSYKTGDGVGAVDISSDGLYIAAGSGMFDEKVYLFSCDFRIPLWSYKTGGPISDVSISSDGSYIVAGSYDNKIYLFSRDSSTPLWSYTTGRVVWCVSISSDGSYIAAGSYDNKIYLFSRDSGTPLWSYTTGDWVEDVSISSDGSYVVAGSWDDKVYLFSRDSSTPLWSHTTELSVRCVSISSDGSYIAAGSSKEVYLFSRDSSTPLWNYTTGGYVHDVFISSDGSYIAAGSGYEVYLFSRDSSTPLWSYTTGDLVVVVSISSDGSYIAAGSGDNVHLFSSFPSTLLWSYMTRYSVRDVSISSDGSYIAVGSDDRKVYLFSREHINNPPIASFTYFTEATTVNFIDQSTDPDGTIVAWHWDFGDGFASTLQNPIHQYSTAGTYTVTLTVTDGYGATDAISQSITVSIPEKISTILSISPPSFTVQSGESITLTATLRDYTGDPLAGKLVFWTAPTEVENIGIPPVAFVGMTDSFGQTSITYTAPDVTAETRVKVTASFAGDDDYLGSGGTSTGTITPTALTTTSILISPLVFDAESEENVVLTVLLTGEGGVPLAGKLIHLSTTQGVVTPMSATTDDLGRVTATFTAPRVDVRTSFILSAIFAGDNEHSPSHAYSTGTVRSAALARTVERIEQSIERIEVRVEELETTVEALVEKIENAIVENRLGTIIVIENAQGRREYEHAEVEAEIEVRGTNIEVRVDSKENHKTVLVNIDDYTKKVLQLDRIGVWVDNVQIEQADDYDDVLDPTDDEDEPEYLVLVGRNGAQVLISIPRFSTRTITIAALPTAGIPLYIMIVIALVVVAISLRVTWKYFWVSARKLPKVSV
jgi:WD40 repeat protein